MMLYQLEILFSIKLDFKVTMYGEGEI